jgi:AcrR family transcriptional regulator
MNSINRQKGQRKGKIHQAAENPITPKVEAMDGFMRRKEQSKEDIRKAAGELFSQFGVEKVSIVEIARKAGVSQATIYNNFGSKEGLVREFINTMANRLVDELREILTSDKSYREKLVALPQFAAEITSRERPSEADGTVFPTHIDLLNDPEMRKIRDSAQEEMTNLFLELIREGKEEGQANPDLSEEAFSIYFKFVMNMFLDPQLHYRLHNDPKLMHDLLSLFMYGISGKGNTGEG